jgi:hypothetical protein
MSNDIYLAMVNTSGRLSINDIREHFIYIVTCRVVHVM